LEYLIGNMPPETLLCTPPRQLRPEGRLILDHMILIFILLILREAYYGNTEPETKYRRAH